MADEQRCILTDYRTDKCAGCTKLCPHRISLHGLDGDGGRVGNAGLPKDYRYVTMKTSPVRDSQPKAYAFLDRYVETFKRVEFGGERIKSMYLWSESPGTGKTTTASALINAWIAADYLTSVKAGKQPAQFSAYFLDVNEWQTLYNEFNRPMVPEHISKSASEKYYRAMERAKAAPFAVYDDIGVREASGPFRSDLHTLVNFRTSNGLPTVYTSNLPIEDMAEVFDERLYDRIRDQCVPMHFSGDSKRGRR